MYGDVLIMVYTVGEGSNGGTLTHATRMRLLIQGRTGWVGQAAGPGSKMAVARSDSLQLV